MKKKIIIPIAVVTAAAAVYAGGCAYFGSHMMPDTQLVGERSAYKDRAGVMSILDEDADAYSLEIDGDTTTDVIYGKEVGLSLDRDAREKAADQIISSQKVAEWPVSLFRKKKEVKVPALSASIDETELDSKLAGLAATTAKPEKSKNASYALSGDRFEIVPEVYGTEIKEDALRENVIKSMKSLAETLGLRDSSCYKEPSVKKDNAALKKTVDSLNKYMKPTITYKLGNGKIYEVSKEDQSKWFKVSKKGKVSFDDDALSAFVRKCGYNYNTFGLPRKLKTQYGRTVTVKGGDYGWWINYDAEMKQLKADVKAGKDVKRDFIYHSEAANHGPAACDYGDTYAEVNLAEQHMFLIVKGKKVLESDFVSGNTSLKRGTPTGTYAVKYKEKDATLNGENYSTPVKWWMPFNGGIGFHDAPWRHGNFGGTIYKTNGSHGCINLPPSVAKKLFSYVYKGMPVLVYRYDADSSDKKTENTSKKTTDNKKTDTKTTATDKKRD